MLIMTLKHELSLIIYLRYFYKTLSSSGVDELLHIDLIILNSSLEKGFHSVISLGRSLFRTLILIWQFWAKLND